MMPNSVEPQIPRTKQSEELGGEEKHMAMNDPLLVYVGSSTFTFVKGLKKKTLCRMKESTFMIVNRH